MVEVVEVVNGGGCVMVVVPMTTHPFLSVTMQVYVPGGNALAVFVVCEGVLDQE